MTPDDLIAVTRARPSEAPLVFSTDAGPIGAGYHVTELKLARISSIDCVGRTDAWTEVALQLLDGQGASHMAVGKFTRILEQSTRRVECLGTSPLRIEFAHGNDGLRIYEPSAPELINGAVSLRLRSIHAQCKPATAMSTAAQTDAPRACSGPGANGCCG
ncbi:MAG: DUF6428 family protein [Pseudomonadota bacterium]